MEEVTTHIRAGLVLHRAPENRFGARETTQTSRYNDEQNQTYTTNRICRSTVSPFLQHHHMKPPSTSTVPVRLSQAQSHEHLDRVKTDGEKGKRKRRGRVKGLNLRHRRVPDRRRRIFLIGRKLREEQQRNRNEGYQCF